MRLKLRLRTAGAWVAPRHTPHLFGGLGLSLTLLALSASCVAHRSLIDQVWKEAVQRSGYPSAEIRRPEIIEPPAALKSSPLPRDDENRPVVARYFPLSHQVRIYARIAMPMRRILLREFLYAIYFDRLTSKPLEVDSLAGMDSARQWVDQALARDPDAGP